MTSRKTIYSGELAISMQTPALANAGLLCGPQLDPDRAKILLGLLMGHYHIDPKDKDAVVRLAAALVIDHVPAFSVSPARPAVGRPKTKTSVEESTARASLLLLRVEEMRHKKPSLSEVRACELVLDDIQLNEPSSHYAKRKLATVRADVTRAKKERYRKLLVAALMGEPSSSFRSSFFFGLNTSGNATDTGPTG